LEFSIKDLPGNIQISSTHVQHCGANEQISLDLVIDQQKKVAAEHGETLMGHMERMDLMDEHVNEEIVRVVDWVTEKKKEEADDLVAMKSRVEKIEFELNDRVSYFEVEEKIAIKVKALVDNIKEALLSVEDEEADFKNVANALHGLFNSLKESKADKSDMARLRHELISAQLGGPSPNSTTEGILDYRGLRKILNSYSKTEVINKKLDAKAPADLTFQRLEHSEEMIDKILKTVDEIWNAISNTSPMEDKEVCIPSSTALRAAIVENASETSNLAKNVLSSSTPVSTSRSSQRINYHISRPRTATSPPKEVQCATRDIRRGTTAALNRPYTSPNFRQSYRKSVVPNTRHLPAIESKKFVESDDGKLFVGNSENKLFIRDSTDLSGRKMSVMSFRDGKASTT
jgi:hypothetical protein